MDYKITMRARDFKPRGDKYPDYAPLASSGQLYDLLALSAGANEYNDLDRFSATDPAIDYVLDHYDYETAYIDQLNTAGASDDYAEACRLIGLDEGDEAAGAIWKAFKAQKLKLGAFHALENASRFPEDLSAWTSDIKDHAREYWDEPEDVHADLLKDLQKASDDAENDLMREYLNGDYGGRWRGVYDEAARALFPEDRGIVFHQSEQDRRKNVLHASIDELEGRQIVADYEGCDLTARRIGADRVKKAVIAKILSAATAHVANETAARERRRQEHQAQKERQEAAEAAKADERRRKLSAMTA